MNNQKKKKSGGSGFLVAFLVIFLLPRLFQLLENADFRYGLWKLQRWAAQNGIDPEQLPGMLVAVLVAVIFAVTLLSLLRRKKAAAEDGPVRAQTNSAGGRTSAAKSRPDPRSRSFTPPEPSCIVCDHTGEDHFAHDKAQRIAQLDEWLKNGLIDKAEYRVLKDRFERDL